MKPVIILGSGLAGYTVAREFRKLDKATPLVVITSDSGGFYSKPMLSNAFAQNKGAAQLVTQTAVQMAAQIDADIVTATQVTALDTEAHTITAGGTRYEYQKLVIATGAQAIRLKFGGDAADQVLSVNHVDDYAIFRTRITDCVHHQPPRIAIIGAGLIGCEFADDLAGAGHAVTLIDPNALPLAALAAPVLSQALHEALNARGVDLRLGTTAIAIDHDQQALKVTLANGEMLQVDIVLSAVGLRPDIALAQAAQLKTNRGIVVDTMGKTSADDVYAVGDCAEYTLHIDGTTRTLPYITPLMTAARAIARTLTGQPTVIDLKASPVIVKTPSLPLALVPPPIGANVAGQWHLEKIAERFICRFYDDTGVMTGFGVAPHEASIRLALIAELGIRKMDEIVAAPE